MNDYAITVTAGENPNYTVTVEGGTFSITPKAIKIKAVDKTKVYDNDPDTDPALEATVTGVPANGVAPVYSLSRVAGQDVNSYAISVTAEAASNPNYTVTVEGGTFSITQKAITIKADDKEKDYDNNPATDPELTATVTGVPTKGVAPVYSLSRVAGQDAKDYAISVAAEAASNPNYKVTVEGGTFTIRPIDAEVTITGHTDTADYDGEEHSVSGYDVKTSTDLYAEADFSFNGTANAVRTIAGTTNMGLAADQFVNNNANFKSVTFDVTDGWQKIDPIDVTVTITEHSGEADYDGTEHTVSGYDVEIGNKLYKVSDFTFSGNDSVSGTNADTYAMELKPEDFANNNANFKTVTFEIEDGSLVINPIDVTVTITENSGEADYDGEEHTVTGYKAAIANPLYTEADFTFSGNDSVSGTDADTYAMELKPADFANTNTNFRTVTFEIVDGELVIHPIDATVTITGHNNTATYDGEEHRVEGYDTEIDNDLYTEDDFTFSGTAEAARTDEGTTVMNLAADQFENTNTNFATVTFDVTDGYQTIVPVDEVVVTITGHRNTTSYDGEAHGVEGYDVAISNPLYTEADFTFSGTAAAERTNAGTTNMGLAADQFANTNSNFAKVIFNVTDGYQRINPINATVTITEHSGKVAYDGEEHTVSGYDVAIGNKLYKAADFTFSGNDSVSGTNAGTYAMELKPEDFTNTNANFAKVTFVILDGELVIDPIDVTVTITEHSGTAAYDGTEHTVSGYDVAISNALYKEADFTFSGSDSVSGTNAGTYAMNLKPEDFANTNANFRAVTFGIVDGELVISPINAVVTITGHKDTKDYDGEAHSVSGYDVVTDTALYTEADFTFSGAAEAIRTDVGTTAMGLNAAQFANINPNFATVTFNVTDGSQAINPIDVTVTITEHSGEAAYDGTEHTVTGYDVAISNPLYKEADFTFSGDAAVAGMDAGTYEMNLKPEDFTNTNANFANVTFVIEDGSLVISPIDVTVTITEHSGRYTYDAAAHTVSGYDVAISDPLYTTDDFTFSGNASVSGTNAGTYAMALKPEDFTNTNANFATVSFVIVDGVLTIDPKPVQITADDKTKTYGEADPTLTYTVNGLAGNDFIIASLSRAAGEDAGTYAISVKAEPNPNYVIETLPGTLTIGRRAVTVTADNKIKVYGDADPELTAKVEGLAEGDGTELIAYTLSRAAGEDVGEYAITAAGEAIQGNYTVAYVPAILTIVPENTVVVTITANNGEFVYDGTEHDLSGYSVAISDPLYTEADFTFTGSNELKGTNAGTYRTAMTAEDFANINANFENVVFQVENGELEITRRNVTLTSANATKPYDGTPLTADSVEQKGFVDGEGADVLVTGQITRPGSINNTFTYTMAKGTLAENYNETAVYGTLTVTPALIHTLNISYVDDKGAQFDSYHGQYAVDQTYSVRSPYHAGYTPDREIVAGIMPNNDLYLTVVYTPNTYTLTINYEDSVTGAEVAATYTATLAAGDWYEVVTPIVPGYKARLGIVKGTMDAADFQVTVLFDPEGEEEPGEPVDLPDYGTPLGIANSILGSGEIIE